MTISFNPQLTTQPASSFLLHSQGWVQGAFIDDPTSRMHLSAGLVASTVTDPIFGGMALTETIPAINTEYIGENITLAVSDATLTAFCVFNQAPNMIILPGNTVQQSVAGMTVNYFRMGSGARIAVKCSSVLANALSSGNTAQQVSWDFANHQLAPYTPGYDANTITGAVWAATNGGQISFACTDPRTLMFAGDLITVTGVVNTGGASTSAFNGIWEVVSTDSTHVVVSAPADATLGTYASGGTITAASGGALSVKVLGSNSNSKIVNYNKTTGAVTWTTGTVAVIQI